ncbi:MAG: branched-chain amino acid ABC transporter substrate-binding protein, partial [Elusimicrobia bacterium]|nr:branched-chain amino acid ABC transporter substrate-binding protein [Elusimicrobiota bacterium]
MKIHWRIFSGFIFGAALAFAAACGSKGGAGAIRLGVAAPMTGDQAAFGEEVLYGVSLAAGEWNERGGVLGKRIEIVKRDDQAKPDQATQAAYELVSEGVAGVIGHFNSGCTIPASEVYHQNNVPMLTPSATNPDITDRKYANIFRVCGRDDDQGRTAAEYAVKTLRVKKVAVLHDRTPYGAGLTDQFKRNIEKSLGAKAVVYYDGFDDKEKFFDPYLQEIKKKDPDLLYFGGIYHQAGPLTVKARELGLRAAVMFGDGVINEQYIESAKEAAEGAYVTFGPDPEKIPAAKGFLEKYRKTYQKPAGAYSIYAYEAANILLSSIVRAKGADGTAVSEEIRRGAHESSIGTIRF